jgi:hypothetical protein
MISLNDPIWDTLKSGYRIVYNAAQPLQKFEEDLIALEELSQEFLNELHHQGDVDTASYAVVPQLVRICIHKNLMDKNVFGLVVCIEDCRINGKNNPALPEWVKSDYLSAIQLLAEFGAKNYSRDWDLEFSQFYLAVTAFALGLPKQAQVLFNLSEDEIEQTFDSYL